MSLPLILLVTLASFAQVTLLPLLVLDSWSAPLLPIALLAAWSVNRSQDQVWLALIPAALLPGILSTERVGWFLLALLPVALLGTALVQTRAEGERGLLWRLPATACVAAAGTLAYLLLLATVARDWELLPRAAPAIIGATAGTSLLAVLLTPILQRRRRKQGLFA